MRIDETCTSICLYSKTRISGWLNSGESLNLLQSRQNDDVKIPRSEDAGISEESTKELS